MAGFVYPSKALHLHKHLHTISTLKLSAHTAPYRNTWHGVMLLCYNRVTILS